MNNFEITYSDGTVALVKRVKRSQLKDLITLQQQLFHYFIKHDLSVGSVISNDAAWSVLEKIASLLPVVGEKEETVGIKLDLIEDDIDQLKNIFFTCEPLLEDGTMESINTRIEKEKWYEPNLISKLHQLNYNQDSLKKIREELPTTEPTV